jgi:hypothetical protein
MNADDDPFRPPVNPTLVSCLHCNEEYDSSRIEWRIETTSDGRLHGFWCCPIPGCDGKGFGFDILPVDHSYRDERGGWYDDDEEPEFMAEGDTPPMSSAWLGTSPHSGDDSTQNGTTAVIP